MLLGINTLMSGALLLHLDRMGHSDSLVIADAHFPAYRIGPPVVEVHAGAPAVMRAIRTVTDPDDVRPLTLMSSGDAWNEAQWQLVRAAEVAVDAVDAVEREEFYILAAGARVIARTADDRTFANAILRKGVTPGPYPTTWPLS